ncbi:uncharacterized protein LOC112055778 [Bicyclus anynana]|uniref:Uncharacterized protein LOC112055778 n=1 Tax=Bicyclus anynana TaxID=110368 RepID=A0A6J1NVM7_BICAN|nr:uncharacterized protein LOC112055778 [Bicyclus anynana]
MMQLRASFLMLEVANKNATKKSNVLAKIVIPRLNVTSHYINSELEEKEREEVFRLKRVKQKKDFEKKLDEMKRLEASRPKPAEQQTEKSQLSVVKSENETLTSRKSN